MKNESRNQSKKGSAAPEAVREGSRVRITDVRFREHAHHACFIGQTGTVKRVWKTKPFVLVTMDSGKDRECCPQFLEAARS